MAEGDEHADDRGGRGHDLAPRALGLLPVDF